MLASSSSIHYNYKPQQEMVYKPIILWISRHGILQKEINDLITVYGHNLIIKSIESYNLSATDVIKYINKFKPVEVVAVLPLEIIKKIMAQGIFPIYAIMDNVNDEHESDVIYDGYKCRKFVRFVRYKNINFNYFYGLNENFVMNPRMGFKPISNKILFFSSKRKKLSQAEQDYLISLYDNQQLEFVSTDINTDITLLTQQIKNNDYLDVVVEASQSVLVKLSQNWICPLIVQRQAVTYNQSASIVYDNGNQFIFCGFKRLKALQIEFANYKSTNLFGQELYKVM